MPVPFPILTDLPSPLVSLHFSGIQPTRPTHTVVNIPRPRMANDGHAPLPFRPSLLLATGKITSNFRRAKKRSVVDKKFTSLFSKRGERVVQASGTRVEKRARFEKSDRGYYLASSDRNNDSRSLEFIVPGRGR